MSTPPPWPWTSRRPEAEAASVLAYCGVLTGLALTPLIAYLIVANVFIYLNLRYEFFYSARER